MLSEIQFQRVGTSEQIPRRGNIEVIDVEQVKDKPVVDLTDDSRSDVIVDLTCSPDVQQLPHRQSVIRWQLTPRKTRSEQSKNTDEILIVPKGSER